MKGTEKKGGRFQDCSTIKTTRESFYWSNYSSERRDYNYWNLMLDVSVPSVVIGTQCNKLAQKFFYVNDTVEKNMRL